MQNIVFNTERPYTAFIGSGASILLSERVRLDIPGAVAAIVTDSGVPTEHVELVRRAVLAAGKAAPVFVLPCGERNKNAARLMELYGFLYDSGLTRDCGVIAVGGGMAGDMAGFAASTYLRGVAFINVPTTVISQTDSAYGGKTGIDLGEGKNHIGSFYQPASVVCDTDLLRTLTKAQRLCGMGEVIKYGAIACPALLDRVVSSGDELPGEAVIAQCVDIKRRFTEADPFDRGERRILNFGHTIGHAVEAASGYTVPHGQAVAYGMLAACSVGMRLGVTAPAAGERISSACRAAGLDTEWRPMLGDALPLVARDKKADSESVDFILLREIGRPFRMKLELKTVSELLSDQR